MEENKKDDVVRVIHVKVIGGNPADIYEIGNAMKKFKESLPFRLEALITNENVELRDTMTLIKELWALKRSIDGEKKDE